MGGKILKDGDSIKNILTDLHKEIKKLGSNSQGYSKESKQLLKALMKKNIEILLCMAIQIPKELIYSYINEIKPTERSTLGSFKTAIEKLGDPMRIKSLKDTYCDSREQLTELMTNDNGDDKFYNLE